MYLKRGVEGEEIQINAETPRCIVGDLVGGC